MYVFMCLYIYTILTLLKTNEGLKDKGIHINATKIMIYSLDVVRCLVEIIWASRIQ